MTTKETALQEAINILCSKNLTHCMNIQEFNHYWRKHGGAQLNPYSIAIGAASHMEREGNRQLFEYNEKPTFLNH